ncbi:RIO1 family regulatory kinase/ATPase domain-containing protein [Selenomonas ruminantium]|uniref:non-specific serine/threonine protein kinase n=1 Tax=Selenomonas ruminantium TaxID=971 RepID=A0A1I0XY85_SELRU|nr:RIO1 family regulatory kinase/ATPase [Selenomonas ruminantium]SFB05260.1 tRNA A-37 threonylcarbamoyl transferase component Bud32 [Selenomonas ruminantium]
MQFNSEALKAKEKYLDKINYQLNIVEKVIERNLGKKCNFYERKRIWCGGGGSLFIIEGDSKIFLKIKHKAVTVESKLEEETGYIKDSCIEHEKKMLELADKAGVHIPDVVFFDEESGYQFLATEYVGKSLEETLQDSSLEVVLSLWDDLEKNVRKLFEAGIVHCDIHELNIRCHDGNAVLIDFEEARVLHQDTTFENSLDYIGSNANSSLGDFPLADKQEYTIKYNCLARMKQVFKRYIVPKVIEYTEKCNYDSTNGICIALDHGESDLTYQSIENKWFKIQGQRELKDNRPKLISALISTCFEDRNISFVDVGSNNGLFGREIAKEFNGSVRCIGLEGFHNFNVLAKSLAFLDDCKNVEYYDFVCGDDDLKTLNLDNDCFMSICSVWHHIERKDIFLKQLKNIKLKFVFLEMPSQADCYNGRTWDEETKYIKEQLEFRDEILLEYSHDYNRPIILLSKERIDEKMKKEIKTIAKKICHPKFMDKILAYFN